MTELGRLSVAIILSATAGVVVPAAVLPIAGPPGAVRVVFLSEPDPSQLPDGVTMDVWGRSAVLEGVDARAARTLYAMGAVVVYPVRVNGCIALRSTAQGAAT